MKCYYLKLIILIHILRFTVYASNEPHQHGRKHSTAHYFSNGTVYILGGIEYNKVTTKTELASPITFIFNNQELSVLSNDNKKEIPPTIGHTSHLHVPSNSIISVFGMQQDNKESPPLIPSFHQTTTKVVPSGRFRHTSVILNNTLYVIGGANKNAKLIESQDMIWNYSFSTNTWKSIGTTTNGMAGHISIVYKQYIISCFGYQSEQLLLNGCTWFDTKTFDSNLIFSTPNTNWPSARIYSNVISLDNDKHILFGGQVSDNIILDDLWQIQINKPFEMNWQRIRTKTNYKRSGHASALLEKEKMILYYGGQVEPQFLATDPIYLDLSKMDWIQTTSNNSIRLVRNDVDLSDTAENHHRRHGLGGGAIAGIILSIVGVVALSIGFFIWKKRVQRQNNIHLQSRAARFSQSPTPMHSIQDHNSSSSLQRMPGNGNFLSLPELALSRHSSKSRISSISLGEEFQFSTDSYQQHRQSHQSTDSAILGQIPKIECIQEEETIRPDYKRRESTGFKRLTLNLFSSSQDESKKKDRSSSLFQLRSSKLLLPNTPNTLDGKFPSSKGSPLNSRVSLGAKSVSSIQWVGFNDNMDYKGRNWRDSSTSSMHLAVTNAQRASSHYTTDSAQSTPRSPMFPSHLRDSAAHYQLNEMESNSWKASVNKNSSTTS